MAYWSGKSALVTGGSSGLGLAVARQLVIEGGRVALVARSREPLDAAAEMFAGLGGKVLTLAADVTEPGCTAWAVEQAVEEFGGLDLAAACAGRSMRGTVVDTPRRAFEELLAVNFLAAVDLAHAAGPHLEASSGGGHLALVASLAAKTAPPLLGAYPASKHPLAAFAQQLRMERQSEGLHTLLVCPGPITRDDGGRRYQEQADGLPDSAHKPGGGARVRTLDADDLARRILRACEKRKSELVLPRKARLLFALAQLSPDLGDWLLRRQIS